MIKIVLNDKRIFLVDNPARIIKDYSLSNALILFSLNKQKASDLVDLLLLSEIEHAIIVGDENQHLKILKHTFRFLKAGGGVVFNNKNEILFIYRRKKWDMPKGKLDRGEDIEACAKREVNEETGIKNLETVQLLTHTYHLYIEHTVILKETTWYLFYSEDHYLKPQANEGIQKAIWVHKNNVRFQLNNTYPAVHDIFRILASIE